MLQPLSMNELPPLLSSLSGTNNCGLERLVISVPTMSAMSYDWSDFPVVERDSISMERYEPQKMPTSQTQVPSEDILSIASDSDLSSASSESTTSSSRRSSSSRGKSVTFDSHIHVRTHSIVLGEHPCCAQLALELGWEHDAGQLIDLEEQERIKRDSIHRRRRGEARRLSYFERKAVFEEFGRHDR